MAATEASPDAGSEPHGAGVALGNAWDAIFVKRHRGTSGYHDEVFHDDEHVLRTLTEMTEGALPSPPTGAGSGPRRGADGQWRSTRAWVEEYRADRHKRQPKR